jgi:antitoxin (DNA-binding transcriptional repressor) of toxin-antitoxin stability system
MKTATVRDLRYDFPKIEAWLRSGETIEITKHSWPVGVISPARPPQSSAPELPDFEARLKRLWGDRVFTDEETEEMRAFETGEP